VIAMVVAAAIGTAVLPGVSTAATGHGRGTRLGATPRLPAGSKALSALAGGNVLPIDVALEPADPAALAAYAQEVSTPQSPLFRDYLDVAQFAQRFGPSRHAIRAVRKALAAAGLHGGALSANHLSIAVRASSEALSRAFDTAFRRYQLPGGRIAYANTAPALIAASAAPYVQGVIGLNDLYVATSSAQLEPSSGQSGGASPSARQPAVATGGPQPCAQATDNADGSYTADQLASAYGFSSPYGAGDLGSGQTVALVEFEPDLASDISAYDACYGVSTPVTYVKVDGGAGTGSGQGEAAADIEDISGLAPDVSILVYEGPNNDQGSYDTYSAIFSADAAKVVSTSWGLCEPELDSGVANSENTLFEEAAAQGQTVVAAAGDQGSEDCAPTKTSLAVDDPSSQPYVTGVGGTEITALGPPPAETVWNTGPSDSFGAGGGGISSLWAMPSYQSSAAPSVDVIDKDSSGTPCGKAGGYCRQSPDVSAVAGPYPYVFYFQGSWASWGGTSLSAPLWASLVALANASTSCAGKTVGFANPTLYSVAASDPSAFHDITIGNNDMTGKNDGLYPAGTGYDMASGLGTPNGARLPADLCAGGVANSVSMNNPGHQNSDVGQRVSLRVTATDSTAGQSIAYAALGLPKGLALSSSGFVSGAPTTSGTSVVVVTAEAHGGASDSATFDWSVAPKVTKVRPAAGTKGTTVTIHGHGLQGATAVNFGSTTVRTFTVNKVGTKLTVVAPASSGVVTVTVTAPYGTSPAISQGRFTYTAG
jgi:subtilase family serine protease